MTFELPATESLTVEFKRDDHRRQSDDELAKAVVCLANRDGGTLYLGVDDATGAPRGIHPDRDLAGLTTAIYERTRPALLVRVETLVVDSHTLALLHVPASSRPVATTKGLVVRRDLDARGRPLCRPWFPDQFDSHLTRHGELDVSRGPWPGAAHADLDPAARHELRRLVESNRADQTLLELSDDELDHALHLVDDAGTPTLTGLLLVGRSAALRRLVPTHEVAFQVLTPGEDLAVNDFSREPLVRLLPWMEERVAARNDEVELEVGLVRVGIPRVDDRGFREALVNAVSHRDYQRNGAVHVQWRPDRLEVVSPGGLLAGVRVDRLLTMQPKPRNPALTDALKRVGLAERTGRGVDRIYRGLARYGRPLPDWSDTDDQQVVVSMRTDEHDEALLRWVVTTEQAEGPLPVDTLLVVHTLREQGPSKVGELARSLQRSVEKMPAILKRLEERGVVTPRGNTKGRLWELTVAMFQELGDRTGHVRHTGLQPQRQQLLVMQLAEQTPGGIQRRDVVELLGLPGRQATQLLGRLVEEGRLRKEGERRWTRYFAAEGA